MEDTGGFSVRRNNYIPTRGHRFAQRTHPFPGEDLKVCQTEFYNTDKYFPSTHSRCEECEVVHILSGPLEYFYVYD